MMLRSFVASVMLLGGAALLTACADDDLTAPARFTAEVQGTLVHTAWEAGTGQDMYLVMRTESGTSTTVTFEVPETTTTYDDTTPESGKTYTYMVHGMQGQKFSPPSNMVTVSIP